MAKLYDDTLPCLQAIGPWWEHQDRLNLFCYLKDVFGLDAEYLASLPAAKMTTADGELSLTAHDIEAEYKNYTILRQKSNKKMFTCSKIREYKFSFGKINKRLCFLCPYCKVFKNYNLYDEFRFIFYLMQSSELSLNKYAENDKDRLSEIFISYFPSYIDGILFDAFPFSIFAEAFLKLSAGDYLHEPEKAKEQILVHVREAIDTKINYIHNKNLYFDKYPDYKNMLKSSADKTLSFIEHSDFRRSFNRPMIARLYSLIKNNRKYIPLEPHTYLNENSNYFDTDRFVNSVPDFYKEENQEKSISPENELNLVNNDIATVPENEAALIKDTDVIVPETLSSAPDNVLLELEDESMKSHKNLDTDIFMGSALPEYNTSNDDVKPSDTLENKEEHKVIRSEKSESIIPEAYEKNPRRIERYMDFYQLNDTEDIFIYGTSGNDNDQMLFNILIDDASYLAMEPVCIGDSKGVLISNPSGNKLFYSVESYGPRPIRKIADSGITVYTSNLYHLCRYLYKAKIFKLNIKDVGIALSIQRNQALTNVLDFKGNHFPECMLTYAEQYEQAISFFSDSDKILLQRMEHLSSYICADGMLLPFSNMKTLCRVHDSMNIEFLYKVDKIPQIPGVFVFLRATNEFFKSNASELKGLYVDTCTELDKYVPFTSGKSYLLKLNEKGMLIYFTGNELEQSRKQLHLSSCARRCFSKACPADTPVVIEEKTHVHNLK